MVFLCFSCLFHLLQSQCLRHFGPVAATQLAALVGAVGEEPARRHEGRVVGATRGAAHPRDILNPRPLCVLQESPRHSVGSVETSGASSCAKRPPSVAPQRQRCVPQLRVWRQRAHGKRRMAAIGCEHTEPARKHHVPMHALEASQRLDALQSSFSSTENELLKGSTKLYKNRRAQRARRHQGPQTWVSLCQRPFSHLLR